MGKEIKVYSAALIKLLDSKMCQGIYWHLDFRQEEKSLRSFTVAPLGTIYWLDNINPMPFGIVLFFWSSVIGSGSTSKFAYIML